MPPTMPDLSLSNADKPHVDGALAWWDTFDGYRVFRAYTGYTVDGIASEGYNYPRLMFQIIEDFPGGGWRCNAASDDPIDVDEFLRNGHVVTKSGELLHRFGIESW